MHGTRESYQRYPQFYRGDSEHVRRNARHQAYIAKAWNADADIAQLRDIAEPIRITRGSNEIMLHVFWACLLVYVLLFA